MFKKQNGITLIALVITIIVMLILAGVVISMVVGDNGIITKSKTAKRDTVVADVTQNLEGAITTVDMEEQATTNANLLTNFKYVASIDTVATTSAVFSEEVDITVAREFANIANVLHTNGSATFFAGVVVTPVEGSDPTIENKADDYYKTEMSGSATSATINGSDGRTYTFDVSNGIITVTGGELSSANIVSLTYKLTSKGQSYKISKPVIKLEDNSFIYDGKTQSGSLSEILANI